jgi:hypothetical protein
MGGTRVVVAALLALLIVPVAGATVTRAAPDGTTLLDGRKVFPIVLAKGPEVGARTPSGADGLDEVVSAGVTFLKVGPAASTRRSLRIVPLRSAASTRGSISPRSAARRPARRRTRACTRWSRR